MGKKTWFIGGAILLALAALLAWAFAPRPIAVELGEATIGLFETTVDEDARTRLRERYAVSAPLAGRLQRIALREGDAVAAGDVLATLAPALSPMLDERTVRGQQARVAASEANLHLAGARIESAQVALEEATIGLRRTAQLAQQGFVAPTKADTDRLALQAAQKELDAATDSRQIARHELEQARAALAAVRDASGGTRFALRAPVSGRVLKVHQTSEGTVALGTPLLEIGDTARMEVVAELLTTDALLALPGSPVRIERWGGPAPLEGRVRQVEPAAFTKVSALGVEEQRVNVLIDIGSPAATWAALGDGYRVGVRVVTRSESRALRVPVSAVFPRVQGAGTAPPAAAGGTPAAVFVFAGGRTRLQPVTVGARNGTEAWILDGLSPGAQVVLYPPAALRDGARATARAVR